MGEAAAGAAARARGSAASSSSFSSMTTTAPAAAGAAQLAAAGSGDGGGGSNRRRMGITVEAHDLTYCVPVAPTTTTATATTSLLHNNPLHRLLRRRRPRPKALLRHVSLTARPGRLLYIMGGSGAGKSTLLDLLAHRPQGEGWVGGGVRYNGVEQARAWALVEPHVAYVRQADVHLAELTVRETLAFAAAFRMR
jgi:ABC-type transport system involved in cytochrome bd biosynthesis fused ATPase/permease subunit